MPDWLLALYDAAWSIYDTPVMAEIRYSIKRMLFWMAGFFVAFAILNRISPCNPEQRLTGKTFATNTTYFLLLPIFNRFVSIGYISIGAALIFHGQSPESVARYLQHGYGPLGEMPLWLQAAIVFILQDCILYWTHRWFHGKTMWRFHAIHHSSEHLDWHSTYRFHPLNIWLSFSLVDTAMLFIGFSPEAVTVMASFNLIYSAMVHANLNWTFGPFKYLFASPVFHRWHHTAQEEGMNKNFAPTFPLLDIVFGTFYMPEGKLPQRYGAPGSDIPESFLGQLIWPFKNR